MTFLCMTCMKIPPEDDSKGYCNACDKAFYEAIDRRVEASIPKCQECKISLTKSRARVSAWCVECADAPSPGDKQVAKDFNAKARGRHPSLWIETAGTEQQRQKARQWMSRNPTVVAKLEQDNSRLRARCTNYGITVADWLFLVTRQDGRCGICKQGQDDPIALVVDHDHVTREVRGLLCQPCNFGLGWLRIDGDMALTQANAALKYVETFIASRPRRLNQTPQVVAT